MTEIIDDIHDQLTKAYMNYFKANEKFERNNSIRTHREARKWLREIRRLAKLRSDEIHIKHNTTRQTRKDTGDEQAAVSTIMQWTYQGKIVETIPEGIEGFVYLITNTTNNKKYIGKKLAQFKTTKPPHKGRKNKRRGKKESDWREYWGSSDKLLEDVEQLGQEKFTREILYYCKSRGEMSYLEAKEQFDRRVLETDEYYNGIINVRVGGSKILRENLKAHLQDTV